MHLVSFFLNCANSPLGESSHTFLKNKQTNYFSLGKTKQKYPWKWFGTRMMFAIHQKQFSFLKKYFISFFTNGANRPGVNRPVRKMVLERIVPGGTGFGANRPVTAENYVPPLFFEKAGDKKLISVRQPSPQKTNFFPSHYASILWCSTYLLGIILGVNFTLVYT